MPKVATSHYPIPSMVNTVSETCLHFPPTLMPSKEVYTYPYMPHPVVPSPPVVQAKVNLGLMFTQSLPVKSFDEQKEQERK